jgi:hypothetical protein
MDEDRTIKRAIPPLWQIPRCKEAANSLHQSIGQRIEPRLPTFECEGVVTDPDGTSGVIIMRTLPSYLAPHRHMQDRHCYVRRNDASEPMSMAEIQERTKRVAKSMEDVDRAFVESADRFYKWIPSEFQRTHPVNGFSRSTGQINLVVTTGFGRGLYALPQSHSLPFRQIHDRKNSSSSGPLLLTRFSRNSRDFVSQFRDRTLGEKRRDMVDDDRNPKS